MDSRTSRFWVILLASVLVWMTLVGAGVVRAANTPPIAEAWNITSSGKASSSGELLFRVSPGDGRDPVEVTVFVLSGTNETGVASSIRRALSTQLDGQRFDVEAGEGANVLVRAERADKGFSVELVDSDVDDVRVMVQSATPVAPPTVPQQQVPANPPATPRTPPAPGDAAPPEQSPEGTPGNPAPQPGPAMPSAPPSSPSAPPAQPSSPQGGEPGNSSAPPAPSAPGTSPPANGGAGAPASAPPPPPGT
ncbi:MAG TPA: hypothetical protein VF033_17430 [Steroidobacteraceae bacterium]|jgi:hypothetical protein